MTAIDVQREHIASPVLQVQATVRLVGTADEAAITELSGTIRGLIAVGVRHVVVDVSEAGVVHGRLLTVLARTHVRLSGAEPPGSLRLVGVHLPDFAAALEAADLDEVFVVYDAVRRSGSRGGADVEIPAPGHRRAPAPGDTAVTRCGRPGASAPAARPSRGRRAPGPWSPAGC